MMYLLEGVETTRILFRRIDLIDFNSWVEFFEDSRSFQYWISEREDPKVECGKWYQKQFQRYESDKGGMNALIEKSTGNLIGHAGLLVQVVDGKEELEIAYSLVPRYWNKGFASEAALKCKELAFENDFSSSLISIISLTNAPSANVALKNGMTIDKQTVYNENVVNIFRVYKKDWSVEK